MTLRLAVALQRENVMEVYRYSGVLTYRALLPFVDLDAWLTLGTVSPYLLSLELSKSSMAAVSRFVAEPRIGFVHLLLFLRCGEFRLVKRGYHTRGR
jgi:hypothetical protein